MISLKQAQGLLKGKALSFGTEQTSLENAFEHILAEDIFAPRDFPPFNRSAMDGIAFNFDDFKNGITAFKCVEIIFAGKAATHNLKSGECYKIMTGAAVPICANTVIRVEDLEEKNGFFHLKVKDVALHQNIATQGQDFKKNQLALKKGSYINAATIGLLASFGKKEILTEKLPTVNIITTGDEVLDLHQTINDLSIYNSNKYVLKSLLKSLGIKANNICHVKDEETLIKSVIQKSLNTDILILTGGVSAGDADFIPKILNDLGITNLFYKVAIKPGKPIWCGELKGNTMVFALPGNPFSTLVTFKLFVEFFIKASLSYPITDVQHFKLNFDRLKKTNFDEFFPAELASGNLNQIKINGSGDIRLGFNANYICQHDAEISTLKNGDMVKCITL